MEFFGLRITRASREKQLQNINDNRGWISLIRESFAGAWQTNVTVDFNTVVSHPIVFACMTRIAQDVAKLHANLVQTDSDGINTEVSNPAYSPVLRKPNPYQNRIQFFEHWVLSKLARGNTYALKRRDARGVVNRLDILDPNLVRVLVADDGEVFYDLQPDNMAGTGANIVVPASEIIHDRMNCLFHPLVGLSPIFANGLAATLGLNIQNDATNFFGNRAMPGGVLTAPGEIRTETAQRLKEHWEANYSGANAGKIAVLGDGLTFAPMRVTARDSQVEEQIKLSAEAICSTFHVPAYKVGVGTPPAYNNIQALNVEYYSQAIQPMLEGIELCLNEGLGMAPSLGVEFDVDGLLRMDSMTQMEVLEKAKSLMTLDERRAKVNRRKITGGDTVYLQQQDHSIEAIAARDKLLIEQANNNTSPPAPTGGEADLKRLRLKVRRRMAA